MPATIQAPPRRPIARRDFRRGLRRYTMHNEAMAFYDAHPEAWAELIAISDQIERDYGPPPPLPRYTKFSLRGEVFRTADHRASRLAERRARASAGFVAPL